MSYQPYCETILDSQGTTFKWFENYHPPRYFNVEIEDKYSKPKGLTFSVQQGSCSGANLFTCYCSLIDDQINNCIPYNGFIDDHFIHKNLKVGSKDQEQQTKTDLEEALKQIKCWMDTMHLKLNSEKLNIFFSDPKHN